MAYTTYTTKAIVCGSYASNTSDKSFLLFTKEAGMLWASARSVREEKSRQRCALQDFSLIRVSLVKGKAGWKIGSVEVIANPFLAARDRNERGAVAATIKFLRRFMHGTEPNESIFTDVETVLLRLVDCSADERQSLLDLFYLRSLYELGYIAPQASYVQLLRGSTDTYYTEVLIPAAAHTAVAEAMQVSHL